LFTVAIAITSLENVAEAVAVYTADGGVREFTLPRRAVADSDKAKTLSVFMVLKAATHEDATHLYFPFYEGMAKFYIGERMILDTASLNHFFKPTGLQDLIVALPNWYQQSDPIRFEITRSSTSTVGLSKGYLIAKDQIAEVMDRNRTYYEWPRYLILGALLMMLMLMHLISPIKNSYTLSVKLAAFHISVGGSLSMLVYAWRERSIVSYVGPIAMLSIGLAIFHDLLFRTGHLNSGLLLTNNSLLLCFVTLCMLISLISDRDRVRHDPIERFPLGKGI